MLRPIFSAMTRNKTGVLLVAMQIAIALAVIINAVFIVQQRLAYMSRDTGMPVDDIISVGSFGFGETYDQQSTITEDLALLKALPGVVSASYSSAAPLSGSGSANGFNTDPDNMEDSHAANYYLMDHNAVETLGVQLAAGRSFRPEEVIHIDDPEIRAAPTIALATRAFMAKLFPDETDFVGKTIFNGNEPVEIIGVIEKMHGAWVSWDNLDSVIILPVIDAGVRAGYLVRTQPGEAQALVPVIEDKLGQSNRERLINEPSTLRENADRSYARDRGMAVALAIVIALLVTVTALGIVGLAAFNVRARTKQIGTRRAVGARRSDILTYFLAENWLLTTGGVVLGVVLTFALNYYLATEYSLDKLDPLYVPVGILTMWGLGLLAVLGPAQRASTISPAVATRTV